MCPLTLLHFLIFTFLKGTVTDPRGPVTALNFYKPNSSCEPSYSSRTGGSIIVQLLILKLLTIISVRLPMAFTGGLTAVYYQILNSPDHPTLTSRQALMVFNILKLKRIVAKRGVEPLCHLTI